MQLTKKDIVQQYGSIENIVGIAISYQGRLYLGFVPQDLENNPITFNDNTTLTARGASVDDAVELLMSNARVIDTPEYHMSNFMS